MGHLMNPHEGMEPVLVACPDSRPPAYQAVIGLHRAGLLHSFHTAYYYKEDRALAAIGRRLAPRPFARVERALKRRYDPDIPAGRVRPHWSFDLAVRLEARLGGRRPA